MIELVKNSGRNIGSSVWGISGDRVARVALGIGLLTVGLGVVGGTAGIVIAAASIVPFATAAPY